MRSMMMATPNRKEIEIGYIPMPPLSNASNMLPNRLPIATRPPRLVSSGGRATRLYPARTTLT